MEIILHFFKAEFDQKLHIQFEIFRMGYLWFSLCIGLAKSQEHNLFTKISTDELSYYESAETILTLNQACY